MQRVVHALDETIQAVGQQAGRCHLHREWEPVQLAADGGHEVRVVWQQLEIRLHLDHSADEQLDRGVVPWPGSATGGRNLQRPHSHHRLVRQAQRFARGNDDRHLPAGSDDLVHVAGDGIDQVLNVVQHDQQLLIPDN
jgi:hypothetical protein